MNNVQNDDAKAINQQVISEFLQKYGNKSVGHRKVMEKVINNFIKSNETSQANIKKLHKSLVAFKPVEKKFTTSPSKEFVPVQLKFFTKMPPLTAQINTLANPTQKPIYGLFTSQEQQLRKPLSYNRPEFFNRSQPFKVLQRHKFEEEDSDEEEEKKSVYMLGSNVQGDEWATMVKFDTQIYQNELEQKRKLKAFQREGLRAELDRQIEGQKKQKEQAKKEEDDYYRIQQQIWQKHDTQESQKLTERMERNNALKQDRDFQIKMKTKRVKEEKKEEHKLKQFLKQKYISDVEQEEEMRRQRRIAEKEFLYKVMKQSEEDKLLQKQQESEQIRVEQEQFNKYGQFLDQTERKKNEEKKQREEKIKRLMHRWDQNDYVKEFRDKVKEEQKIQDFYAKVANEKAQKEEEEKKLKKQRQKQETNRILEEQVKQHHQQIEEQKKIDKLQGELWKDDTERFLEEEKQKKEIIKNANLQQKNILQKQILSKKRSQNSAVSFQKMTIDELMQNKDTLKKIIKENQQSHLEKVDF